MNIPKLRELQMSFSVVGKESILILKEAIINQYHQLIKFQQVKRDKIMRHDKRNHIQLHICQQEDGKQGRSKVPCQMAAEEGLPSHQSEVP